MSTASARLDSPVPARAAVESLLRARKLDRTLTSSRPAAAPDPGVPFDVQPLDAYLQGGLPAGQLSEVVGPRSSGRTTVVWRWMAAATRRGDTVALIDTFDRFDPESAVACGLDLDRLLWVRGQAISKTAGAVDPVWLPGVRTVGRPRHDGGAHGRSRAQGAQPGAAVGRVPGGGDRHGRRADPALRRIPYTTWLRVQRVIEGSDTTCVLVAPEPLARSAGGVTLTMQAPGRRHAGGVAGPGRRSVADGSGRPRTWPGGARAAGPALRRAALRRAGVVVAAAGGGPGSLSGRAARRSALGRAVGRVMFAALYSRLVAGSHAHAAWRSRSRRASRWRAALVLCDLVGVARLFGGARDIADHLRRALVDAGPVRVAVAPTHTAAALLALGRPGRERGRHARRGGAPALAQLPVAIAGGMGHDPRRPAPTMRPPGARHPLGLGASARHAPGPADPPAGARPRADAARQPPGRRRGPRAAPARRSTCCAAGASARWGSMRRCRRRSWPSRLGPLGPRWQRAAYGHDMSPLVPLVDDEPFEASLALEWPVEGLEPLSFVLARVLEPLAARLERADRGAAVLHTELHLTSREQHVRTLQLPAPMRDPKTLRTLILLDLESHPADAAVDRVVVARRPTPGASCSGRCSNAPSRRRNRCPRCWPA